jgi:hypothetical protein
MADTPSQGRTKFAEFLWEAFWQSEAYPESPEPPFQNRGHSALPTEFGKSPGKMANTSQGRTKFTEFS